MALTAEVKKMPVSILCLQISMTTAVQINLKSETKKGASIYDFFLEKHNELPDLLKICHDFPSP